MSSLYTLSPVTLLADLALKSLAVMGAVALIAAALPRASAAWRHLIWSMGIAALMLLPALWLTLPAWRVSWLPALPEERSPELAVRLDPLIVPRSIATVRAAESMAAPPLDHAPAPPSGRMEAAPDRSAAHSPDAPKDRIDWSSLIISLWLAGGLAALTPLGLGLWQVRKLFRNSAPETDPHWRAALDELARNLAIRRRVQLRRSAQATMPLTWGVRQPVLLLPAEAPDWLLTRQQTVLLHELAHIRRCDWLTQMCAHAVCAIYWFNPLVWLAARQMRIERERACDDLVLASGARASDYAQELLALAAGLADPRLATLAAVPMARRSALETRLHAILDSRQSRAALTTAAVTAVCVLVGAAMTPLAMLRAAQPGPAETLAGATPSPSDPTEENDDPDNSIRITVLDAAGDQRIPEFRILAGVPAPGVANEYEKRTGHTVVNWQPHTVRNEENGECLWPLDTAYETMAIRIEADGYQPQIRTWLRKADGAQSLVFLLTRDPGAPGRVLTPAGEPAAGATVALALPQKDAVLENGKLRGEGEPPPGRPSDRWRRPTMVKTGDGGRFTLPTELEPAAVLVIHDSGVREMPYEVFRNSPEFTLEPWGTINGRVLWGDQAGAQEEVALSIHRDEYGYPGMIASYASVETGPDGSFFFEKVLPGRAQISRPLKPAEPSDSGFTAINLDGLFSHIAVQPGEPTPALIGGQGRSVIGKLTGLNSWEGVSFHLHPTAPHIGFPGDDAIWKAFAQFKESPIGPLFFRDKQPVQEDGSFEIRRILPGAYQLFVSAPGFNGYAANAPFQVEPEVSGQLPAALDLGTVTIQSPAGNVQPAEEPGNPTESAAAALEPEHKTVTIRGHALDDETGQPVGRLIIQAGKFDPSNPSEVAWGYSESRSSASDGSFSTTIRWTEGWTARVLADGYLPQPVVAAAPPADKDEIEVTLRLKRGRLVRGTVLDHSGAPVAGAAVYALGPTGLNLAAGQAMTTWGEPDAEALPVMTNAEGRFELQAGEAKAAAVTCAVLDAWPAEIPAEGELTISLPQPARLEIRLSIDGAEEESTVFYQLLSHFSPEFDRLTSSRELPIANGGALTLSALPPGKYQICRSLMHPLGDFSTGAMLDREFFEIAAGETRPIDWVRETGARLRGKVTWPEGADLAGILVSVKASAAEKSPFDEHEWQTTYSSQKTAEDGSFLTERISPGRYLLTAEAFQPLTPEQKMRTGLIGPAFRAEIEVDVPAAGEVALPEIRLTESRR